MPFEPAGCRLLGVRIGCDLEREYDEHLREQAQC